MDQSELQQQQQQQQQEYNKLITKSNIIGKVLELTRRSYEECEEEARKKNESGKILDKNLQDADKLLKQLSEMRSTSRIVQKQNANAKFLKHDQRVKIEEQTERITVLKNKI